MLSKIKIAVDAMGGDNSPKKVLDGIVHNHNLHKDNYYKIFGNKNEMSLINNSINMHAENILVTYGAEGASYNDISVQAPEIEIVNSNGAGDALIGTFLTCLSTENDYTSLKKAVDYASEVCKSNGPRIK